MQGEPAKKTADLKNLLKLTRQKLLELTKKIKGSGKGGAGSAGAAA